jgi:NADP-dependent aldehyde dehydrogenase
LDDDGLGQFRKKLIAQFEQASPDTMLSPGIAQAYGDRLKHVSALRGVQSHPAAKSGDSKRTEGRPEVLVTDSKTWKENKELREEIFGPATIVVHCESESELLSAAHALEGSLTATIHGTAEELAHYSDLIDVLSRKAGRLIFNGFPTGVEVGYAMHHGGPYPATSDEKFTSVGATAIYRFVRPVCYQNFPEHLLPRELQDINPRNIWRTVNGKLTRDRV